MLEVGVPGGKQGLGVVTYGLAGLATLVAAYLLLTVP